MDGQRYIIFIVITLMLSILLAACTNDRAYVPITKTDNRFVETGYVYYIGGSYHDVVYDKKTQIVYLASTGQRGGITPLLNADGKPMTLSEFEASEAIG